MKHVSYQGTIQGGHGGPFGSLVLYLTYSPKYMRNIESSSYVQCAAESHLSPGNDE